MQSDSISKEYMREELKKDMQNVYNAFKNCDEKGLSKPRIVCAANQCNVTGQTLIGARHWDNWMRSQHNDKQQRDGLCDKFLSNVIGYSIKDEIQGFIDQHGNFYTREEAWLIALENDQIIRRVSGDYQNGVGRLYSENLY